MTELYDVVFNYMTTAFLLFPMESACVRTVSTAQGCWMAQTAIKHAIYDCGKYSAFALHSVQDNQPSCDIRLMTEMSEAPKFSGHKMLLWRCAKM